MLPCPFCGGAAELDHLTDEDDDSFVICTVCEVQQIANYRRIAAIDTWNKRADFRSDLAAVVPDGLQERLGTLREWLKVRDDLPKYPYQVVTECADFLCELACAPKASKDRGIGMDWTTDNPIVPPLFVRDTQRLARLRLHLLGSVALGR